MLIAVRNLLPFLLGLDTTEGSGVFRVQMYSRSRFVASREFERKVLETFRQSCGPCDADQPTLSRFSRRLHGFQAQLCSFEGFVAWFKEQMESSDDDDDGSHEDEADEADETDDA